jgi:hypothetical protein
VTVCVSHHRTCNVVTLATGTLNLQVRRQESPDKPSNLSATEALDSSFVNIAPLKWMDCLSFAASYWTYFSVFNSIQKFWTGLLFCKHGKWVPVIMSWRVLSLRMEERQSIWKVAANILNKQPLTAEKRWSSSLGVGVRWDILTVKTDIVTKWIMWLGHELILWYDLSNGKETRDLAHGMLGVRTGQVHLHQKPGN